MGDRLGRKPVLSISVTAMGVSSFALLPTYAEISAAAPAMLVALRIAQGLCVGGAFPGAMVFLAEHAPPERRGFYASWGRSPARFSASCSARAPPHWRTAYSARR